MRDLKGLADEGKKQIGSGDRGHRRRRRGRQGRRRRRRHRRPRRAASTRSIWCAPAPSRWRQGRRRPARHGAGRRAGRRQGRRGARRHRGGARRRRDARPARAGRNARRRACADAPTRSSSRRCPATAGAAASTSCLIAWIVASVAAVVLESVPSCTTRVRPAVRRRRDRLDRRLHRRVPAAALGRGRLSAVPALAPGAGRACASLRTGGAIVDLLAIAALLSSPVRRSGPAGLHRLPAAALPQAGALLAGHALAATKPSTRSGARSPPASSS